MTKPVLPPLGSLQPLIESYYKRYLPSAYDPSMSIYEQVTTCIEHVNQMGLLVGQILEQWKIVQEWIMGEGLTEAVKKQLDIWLKDGTLAEIIGNAILDNGINVKNYILAVETDHTRAIKEALTKGKRVFAPNNMVYVISETIVMPKGVELDFRGSKVQVKKGACCGDVGFYMDIESRVINAHFEIDPEATLEKGLFYFDGNKKFIVGETLSEAIHNVRAERLQGTNAYKGTFIYFEADQKDQTQSCFVSGVLASNITSTRFEYGIRMRVNKTSLTNNCYLNSNVIKNYTAFNPLKFIWQDDFEGVTGAEMHSNIFDTVICQPSTEHSKVFLRLTGNMNNVVNANFWDAGRPTNKTDQILIMGRFNNVQGVNIPSLDTNYVKITGEYNTYFGNAYGLPSFNSPVITATRNHATMFEGKLAPLPHAIETSVAQVRCNTLPNEQATEIFKKSIDFSKLRLGTYHLKLIASGSSFADRSISRTWQARGGGKWIAGLTQNITGVSWQAEVDYFIRRFEDNIQIKAFVKVTNNNNPSATSYGTYTHYDLTAPVDFTFNFASETDGYLVKEMHELTFVSPL
ncbi:tail spike protein [Bacillus phage DLc1]|uniref:Pre-neck appendage protein n=1 Tax=Bacillus phage DLc1 TaxID=2777318 RepID=A0A7M1RPW1_9CAUD|nr:tail spike protein [Bacillus phage DLc1]QOR56286.1 pre-neck appendage protein [Bacillus phage DLc1]